MSLPNPAPAPDSGRTLESSLSDHFAIATEQAMQYALRDAKEGSIASPELFRAAAEVAAQQISKLCVRLGSGGESTATVVEHPQWGTYIQTKVDTGIKVQQEGNFFFRVESRDRSPA